MRLISVFFFLLLFLLNGLAQNNSLNLYFEDSAGNRDTLVFGLHPLATFEIDTALGEVNTLGQPIDSIFDVFFTDAASSTNDFYFEFDHNPTYISKTQFNAKHTLQDWFEMGIVAKNWPVTISWSQDEMKNYVSEQGQADCNIFLYSWNPPASLLGDVHACGDWPNDYTILNDTSMVVIDYHNFCHYNAPFISPDSISPFYINYTNFTGVDKPSISQLAICYDQRNKAIVLSSVDVKEPITVEVFDLCGRSWMRTSVDCNHFTTTRIDAEILHRGVYMVIVSSVNRCFRYNKKIIIQ